MDDPVLVASTDGVGTKVELAARLGRYRGVGADIVNHCIDDVLVQGARPLFFLDYIAASKIDAEQVAEVVAGMAEACEAAGCALLGGETAEMPGVYAPGAFDIAGTLVGVVEQRRHAARAASSHAGDVLSAWRRTARTPTATRCCASSSTGCRWTPTPPGFDRPLGDDAARAAPQLPRRARRGAAPAARSRRWPTSPAAACRRTCRGCCPTTATPSIQLGSWPVPPLFHLVREVATGSTPTSCTAR